MQKIFHFFFFYDQMLTSVKPLGSSLVLIFIPGGIKADPSPSLGTADKLWDLPPRMLSNNDSRFRKTVSSVSIVVSTKKH